MSPRPVISVVMPTYNQVNTIGEAIDSVLAQSFQNWELIVVDDGCTDATPEVIADRLRRDGRIRSVRQNNQGSPGARNRGIREAQGEYLMFLDSDDLYLPGAMISLYNYIIKSHSMMRMAYADNYTWVMDGNCKTLRRMAPPQPRPGLFRQLLTGNPIEASTVILHRQAALEVGLFDEKMLAIEDVDLWVRVIYQYEIGKIDVPVSVCRIHDKQRSKNLGLFRCYYDILALKILHAISPKVLFFEWPNPEERAQKMAELAWMMVGSALAPYEAALHLLRLSQQFHYDLDRQGKIDIFQNEIPYLIKKYFNSDMAVCLGSQGATQIPVMAESRSDTPERCAVPSRWVDAELQKPFVVAVVIPTILRPSLERAVDSVIEQDLPGRIQILIGVDAAMGDREILDRIRGKLPDRIHLLVIDPGYSTSIRHGGLHLAKDGGAMRTVLSYLANSRYVTYLDDDNWWAPDHLSRLLQAVAGKMWAFTLRWYVDPDTEQQLCVDQWESVGPGSGAYVAKFGGFVDPNCLMIDKIALEPVLRLWSTPYSGYGMDADRVVNQYLMAASAPGATGVATVNYVLNPSDVNHNYRLAKAKTAGL